MCFERTRHPAFSKLKILVGERPGGDSDLSDAGSIPTKVKVPKCNNASDSDPIYQELLNRIAKLEHTNDVFRDKTNGGGRGGAPGNQGTRPKNLTGQTYSIYCANCGVQLTPGKCSNGCIRIKRGHRNLPFPTQAECSAATFENCHQFEKASNQYAGKWGKEWSTCTDPRIVAQAQAS